VRRFPYATDGCIRLHYRNSVGTCRAILARSDRWKLSPAILWHNIRENTVVLSRMKYWIGNSNGPHTSTNYPIGSIGTTRENTDFFVGGPLAVEIALSQNHAVDLGRVICPSPPFRGLQSIPTGGTSSPFSAGSVLLPHRSFADHGAVGHRALPHPTAWFRLSRIRRLKRGEALTP